MILNIRDSNAVYDVYDGKQDCRGGGRLKILTWKVLCEYAFPKEGKR